MYVCRSIQTPRNADLSHADWPLHRRCHVTEQHAASPPIAVAAKQHAATLTNHETTSAAAAAEAPQSAVSMQSRAAVRG
eukprot:COSAG01_NODE_50273_length_364_cov_2.328302_2_plen_78_part_01